MEPDPNRVVVPRRSVAVLAALALAACAAPLPQERPWLEVRSEHFRILSPLPASEAVELARDLELFRAVVEFVVGEPIAPSRVPLLVFAFDSPASYRPFSVPNASGFFVPSLRGSRIVLGGRSGRVESRDVLQHEFVHFLLHNRGVHAYPPWYDEGFAEFLSSVERRGAEVAIGRPLRHRIDPFGHTGWIPVESLMAGRNLASFHGQVAAFYAQSWALVHYLNFGREGGGAREQITTYLRALQRGADDAEAVRLGFGVDADVLGHGLAEYVRIGRYPYVTVPMARFRVPERFDLREPTVDEMARELGWLSLSLERAEQALRLFDAAVAARPDDAGARAGRCAALTALERGEDAEAACLAALAAAPDDALVQLEVGKHWHARARAAPDDAQRDELARRARQHYARSWKLDDGVPETYARYGASYLLPGQDPARGRDTLEQAHRMLPSSVEIKLDLARVYARTGRPDDARALARVAATWRHDPQAAEAIAELLAAPD